VRTELLGDAIGGIDPEKDSIQPNRQAQPATNNPARAHHITIDSPDRNLNKQPLSPRRPKRKSDV